MFGTDPSVSPKQGELIFNVCYSSVKSNWGGEKQELVLQSCGSPGGAKCVDTGFSAGAAPAIAFPRPCRPASGQPVSAACASPLRKTGRGPPQSHATAFPARAG